MSIASNFPAIKPTLLLDFSNTKELDSRVTFTRASTATYYGTQTAKAEENLLIRSQEFNVGGWNATGCVMTGNALAAPDGTTTAELLTANTTGTVGISQAITTSAIPNTFSVFAKAGTCTFLRLIAVTGTNNAWFDLTNGVVGTVQGSTTATISDAGNGWYRCSVTSSVGGATAFIRLAGSDGSQSASDTTTLYVWGAQLEQRDAVTAYTPTTTAPITNYIPVLETAASGVARFDHNPTTFESLGLLIEEQRTNLLTYSEQFDNAVWTKTRSSITANTVVAPDGTLTGDKLVEDTTASNSHVILQSVVFPASGTVTATIYAKAAERNFVLLSRNTLNSCGVNLTTGQIVGVSGTDTTATTQNVGNGWWRVSLVFPSPNITTTINIYPSLDGVFANRDYTGNGYSGIYIWGAQLEAGAFATSYIPTVASQVTRAADAASMTGADFSSWYNQAEGTLYSESSRPFPLPSGGVARVFEINDGTVNNRLINSYHSATAALFFVGANNSTQANISLTTSAVGRKLASAYQLNNFAASVNGGTVGTSATGILPVVTQAQIGSSGSTTLNGHIRKIAYYPIRVSNTNLQALTS